MSFEMGKKFPPSLVIREQKKKSNLITSEKKRRTITPICNVLAGRRMKIGSNIYYSVNFSLVPLLI